MSLMDIALKNVRHNLKSYGLYIGSIVFSIVIYFTFVTLKYSGDVSSLEASSTKISSLMSMSSVILIVFVALFIFYSNAFFMKRRKKEVALYSLLGVRKRAIGWMLFFENIVIGFISLVIGIFIGFFASQGLLAILIKLMGLQVVRELVFSPQAVLHTLIVFAVIFLFTSFQGYRLIYQFKLIDLFHASKQGEKLPKGNVLVAIIGVLFLTGAYAIAAQNIVESEIWRLLRLSTPLVVIAMTVIGSYLLFHSVLVVVLKWMKNSKGWAWKRLNMLTASQLLYRIRGNAKTLTLISILSATTLTAGGSVFGIYYFVGKQVETYAPHSFMWQGEALPIDKEMVESSAELTLKEVSVDVEGFEYRYNVIPFTQYEQLATMQDLTIEPMATEEEAFVFQPDYAPAYEPDLIGTQMQLGEQVVITKRLEQSIVNSYTTGTVIVVSDAAYEAYDSEQQIAQVVNVKNEREQMTLSNTLQKQAGEDAMFSSAGADYNNSLQATGALLFVGTFLGLVFLVATGSVIFFKVLTEAEEDREKYTMLHKIGVSKKDMLATIRAQVGIIFAVPLGLGILHSVFALVAVSNLFMMNILVPVTIWIGVFIVIYIVYYFATARAFYKTISKEFN